MKANALSVMNDIEKEIGVTKTWNLGYRQSEALLAFDFKAPNNTFPIFWLTKQNRNTIFFR